MTMAERKTLAQQYHRAGTSAGLVFALMACAYQSYPLAVGALLAFLIGTAGLLTQIASLALKRLRPSVPALPLPEGCYYQGEAPWERTMEIPIIKAAILHE